VSGEVTASHLEPVFVLYGFWDLKPQQLLNFLAALGNCVMWPSGQTRSCPLWSACQEQKCGIGLWLEVFKRADKKDEAEIALPQPPLSSPFASTPLPLALFDVLKFW